MIQGGTLIGQVPGGTRTFLSRMARRTIAPRPMSTPCMSTESSTTARECTETPGEQIERRTVAPDMITPALTIESIAWPRRSSSSNTNLAGGREP